MNSDTEDENSRGELPRKASEDDFSRRKRPRAENEPVDLVEQKVTCPDSVSTSRVDDGIVVTFLSSLASSSARARDEDLIVLFSSGGAGRREARGVRRVERRPGDRRQGPVGAAGDLDLQVHPARARDQAADAAHRAGAGGAAEADRRQRAEDVRAQEAADTGPGRRVLQVESLAEHSSTYVRHLPSSFRVENRTPDFGRRLAEPIAAFKSAVAHDTSATTSADRR